MSTLNSQQKQLIFDYCVGLTSEEATIQAEKLVSSDKEAAEIHSKIKAALLPLAAVRQESCPDVLAERTIESISALALGRAQLKRLLAAEQARTVSTNRHFLPNFGRVLAAAAVILVAVGIWFVPLDSMRQEYFQQQCQMQLGSFFKGLSNYIADHDGKMPAVAVAENSPWWKVGYQGAENHSNTRHLWLLVKGRYVEPGDFICPGSARARRIKTAALRHPQRLKQYNDFPTRDHIGYSFRIICTKFKGGYLHGNQVIIADLNPLFQNLPDDYSGVLKLRLSPRDMAVNSHNHQGRGQNVLRCNGGISFIKARHADISNDDIFTLQQMSLGSRVRGCEWPSCETDAFLAP